MSTPVICFGQQPCGFFPKRYLYAKIQTARKLQSEIGGKIVFFYHDSDADYRETITILEDLQTKEEVRLNFAQENKLQKKYSPLYLKRIPRGWKEEITRKLPRFVSKKIKELFESITSVTVADFCLEMYTKMGLLDGIEIVRSSDKNFRMNASELLEFYADVPYEGEVVRALMQEGSLRLHAGGSEYLTIPTPPAIEKWQKNPGRDYRFCWMQSGIHATHYIFGAGEKAYLKIEDFPEVTFLDREFIENPEHAYIPREE
jgi:hypothetical protein